MSAVISDCGKYRYTLEREWMVGEGTCLFVMLNPSTADASRDDPTIRRCIDFAQRWGYQRLTVGNLFAYRATKPAEMLLVADPAGPENHLYLGRLAAEADRVIATWGVFPHAGHDFIASILSEANGDLYCLGHYYQRLPAAPTLCAPHHRADPVQPHRAKEIEFLTDCEGKG